MSGKSSTISDFSVSWPSHILPTNEKSKSSILLTVWDGQGQIRGIRRVSIFKTHPRFLRLLAIITNIWKVTLKTVGDVGNWHVIIFTWGKSSKCSNYNCLDLVLFHQILDIVGSGWKDKLSEFLVAEW